MVVVVVDIVEVSYSLFFIVDVEEIVVVLYCCCNWQAHHWYDQLLKNCFRLLLLQFFVVVAVDVVEVFYMLLLQLTFLQFFNCCCCSWQAHPDDARWERSHTFWNRWAFKIIIWKILGYMNVSIFSPLGYEDFQHSTTHCIERQLCATTQPL